MGLDFGVCFFAFFTLGLEVVAASVEAGACITSSTMRDGLERIISLRCEGALRSRMRATARPRFASTVTDLTTPFLLETVRSLEFASIVTRIMLTSPEAS